MSMTSSDLQKTIYQTLNTDSAITSLIGTDNIFDQEIKNANFPYISIKNWQVSDWSTDSDLGEEHLFDIVIYADKSTQKRLQNIAQKVILALHDQPLSLDMGELINLRFENAFFDEEGRNRLQLATLKFRAKVEK